MVNRINILAIIVFFVAVFFVPRTVAVAQQHQQPRPLGQPRTPVGQQPRPSGAERPRQIRPPFVLTQPEQQHIDQLLAAWEAKNNKIETFSSTVYYYTYNTVYGPRDGKPMYVDEGEVKFKRPDKGLFHIKGDRQVKWVCDGKSVFEYKYQDRQLSEYKLPPDLQGKAIEDGPLPFIFTATAQKMKRRFWMRAVLPPPGIKDQHWIEAVPRHQLDAASFRQVSISLAAKDLSLVAIQTFDTSYDGKENKNRKVYVFKDIVINDPLGFLKFDPFAARTPFGWRKVVAKERGQPPRMGSQPEAGKRR